MQLFAKPVEQYSLIRGSRKEGILNIRMVTRNYFCKISCFDVE
jgi:hypothetical protein